MRASSLKHLKYFLIVVFLIWGSSLYAQKARIGDVSITGNFKTKDHAIEIRLPIAKGASFKLSDAEVLKKAAKVNLVNTNLFNDVQVALICSDSFKHVYTWQISLIEKWYIWPLPFVEIADRNINQWQQLDWDPGRTNFGLYLFHYNLFGLNQTLKLSLIAGYTKNLGIEYLTGRLGKESIYRLGAKLKFRENYEIPAFTQNDMLEFTSNPNGKLLTTREVELNIQQVLDNRRRHRITASWTSWNLIDEWMSFLPTDYFNMEHSPFRSNTLNKYSVSSYWEIDHRDNRLYAVSGYRLGVDLQLNHLQSSENETYPEFRFDGDFFKSNNKRLFGYVSMKARKRYIRQLPYLLSNAFGYGDYVRGYENHVVDGRDFALMKTGLRMKLLGQTLNTPFMPLRKYKTANTDLYLGLFSDLGFAGNGKTLTNEINSNSFYEELLWGYGLGLEGVFYYDKVFRFEYSMSRHGDNIFSLYFKQAISN